MILIVDRRSTKDQSDTGKLQEKEEQSLDCPSRKFPKLGLFLFPEVALEQASEGLAVTGLVASHLMDGPPFRYAPRREHFGQFCHRF